MPIHLEVLLAVGYAAFLVGVALGLDVLARHSHNRSHGYRTSGFTYHPTHDAWICPEDQLLTRAETDHERRLIRYRGRPNICNHCPTKGDCTDSDAGREISRAMDPWPHSEAGRFHRGISLVITLLAALTLLVAALRNHAPLEVAALAAAIMVVAAVAWHLHAAFRQTPANFPRGKEPPPAHVPLTGYKKPKGPGPTKSRTPAD